MAFCTIVEWDSHVDFGRLEAVGEDPGADAALPDGCLTRICGQSKTGTFAIEVWQTAADAKRFSEQSAPQIGASGIPAPGRITAFETTLIARADERAA